MRPLKFILSGGGTGGHIYPAIAIANELKSRFPDAEFLFVGASDRMEMQKVPQAGYEIEGLWIAGLQRKLTLQNLMFPIKLMRSLMKSKSIVRKFKPDVVIGTGGFASGPLMQAAASSGIPIIVQEQNSFPGITNKLLGKKAAKICVAYNGLEKYFPKDKLVLTGNPVRKDIIGLEGKREEACRHYGLNPAKKTLLVLGGSLGARAINELIAKEMVNFSAQSVQVIWQCGKFYHDQYKHHQDENRIQVVAFIDRMDLVYAAADVIISRAGASSVSELCIVGKPVIFIPSPNVAEDHQTKNAQSIVNHEAAILLREADLNTRFSTEFTNLLNDEDLRRTLGENIKKLARPLATQEIVDQIIEVVGKSSKVKN